MSDEPVGNATLDSAIEGAIEAHKEEASSSENPQEQKEEVEKKEGETEDLDVIHGKTLVQALKDPQKAAYVIDMLARQAGYTKIETKAEVKEAKEEVSDILKNSMGEEFDFLIKKLGPAIEQILEKRLPKTDDVQELKARLEARETRELESQAASVHTSLSQEFFGSDDMPADVIKDMSKAMDEFPPSPNMSIDTYYRRIFAMVAGERGLTKKFQGQREKIEKNRQDAPARNLTRQNRGSVPDLENGSPKKMSLDEAVKAAIAKANKE